MFQLGQPGDAIFNVIVVIEQILQLLRRRAGWLWPFQTSHRIVFLQVETETSP